MTPLFIVIIALYVVSWGKFFIVGPYYETEEERGWYWRDIGWLIMHLATANYCYKAILESKSMGLTPH